MAWRRWIDAVLARGRAVVRRRRRADQDLHDELSFHLEMETQANLHGGLSGAEAQRRARHDVGIEQAKEECRDVRPLRWARDVIHDLRYALRSLRRTPAFSLVAVVILALGIGATTALFSVVSAVLLRPLPYPDAGRLVRVWTAQPGNGLPRTGTSLPDYRAWREGNRSFEEIGAFFGASYNLTGTDRPEVLPAMRMTASLWTVLKSQPMYGRLFSADAEAWGAHRVVVIGERFFQRRFGGDRSVIGRTIQLNGQPHTLVAVMPASFQFPGPLQEIWVPLSYAPGDSMTTRQNRSFELLGRLKPSATRAQAETDLIAVADRVKRDVPENAGLGVTLVEWQETIVGQIRPTLLLLLGAVGVVLLIVCANMANLLIARTRSREHELSVRTTLGAGRGRLVRQLLTENLLLAAVGAGLGLALAYLLIRAIPNLGPIGVPRLREVTLDGMVVAFASVVTLLTGLAFGAWPACLAGRIGVSDQLKASARTVTGSRARVRARSVLIAVEVALSLVLLVGASLLIVSLRRVVQVDPGFQADHLFTATVTLPQVRYGSGETVTAFVQQAVEQTAALPGIRAAGATTALPLGASEWTKYFSVDGRPAPPSLSQVPTARYRQVSPDYLRTMGASIRRGRLLTAADGAGQPPVAVINETIARRFWPDGNPVGQLISMNPPQSLVPAEIRRSGQRPPSLTVVGVIADFRQNGLERDANAEVFVPFAQAGGEFLPSFFLAARTVGDPLASTSAIQAAIARIDRNLPLANVRTMDSRLADSLAQRRFVMQLLGAFAALALVLAIVGLYGVMAYTVAQRRQEIGVRVALGATAADVLRLVMTEGLIIAGAGVMVGLLLSAGLSRLITSQLFQVSAINPAIYAVVSVLLLIVAACACGWPAFRATRIDPMRALRCE